MTPRRFETLKAFGLSAAIHVLALALVTLSIETQTLVAPVSPPSTVMKAVAVNPRQVEQEVEKLRAAEARRKKAEELARREAEQARREKLEAERKVEELKQERAKIEQARAAEELRLKRAEEQRTEEELRQRQAQEREEKAQAERKAEETRQKELAEKKKAEEARKKRDAEEARKKAEEKKKRDEAARRESELREALEAEEQAARAAADEDEIAQFIARIQAQVQASFINPAQGQQLKCVIRVRMLPGGDVVEAQVVQSSGNESFDRQSEVAVRKAAPLPVPAEARLFERMRTINFEFSPEG